MVNPYVYLRYIFAALPTHQLMHGLQNERPWWRLYEARVAQTERDLDSVLAVYDLILTSQRYIAGDGLTLADLFHLPNGAALMARRWKEAFTRYPNVEKWFRGLKGRENWLKTAGEAMTIP